MRAVDYWYDLVCPYAYLGSTRIERVAAEGRAALRWQPFLLGGVFRAIGQADDLNASMPEAKRRHNARDLERWADWLEVPLRVPAAHPRRTVLALRALLAAGEGARAPATHALYRAYWVDGLDIAEPDVVHEVLDLAGLDGAACVEAASSPAIKDALRKQTDEAVRLGVFGAPTTFVMGEMFWGQDRLDFVAAKLARRE